MEKLGELVTVYASPLGLVSFALWGESASCPRRRRCGGGHKAESIFLVLCHVNPSIAVPMFTMSSDVRINSEILIQIPVEPSSG